MVWHAMAFARRALMNLIDQIDKLIDDDAYEWAFATLCGIRKSLTDGGEETEGRRRAVENIRNAVSIQQRAAAIGEGTPSDKYRGSRRYEGFE
jgi:hypothetical protein